MRIGQGFDVHAFTGGRPLVLGGVTIPHDKGLAAHSDGDAVIHALCDALLGAAALGDIGAHFPDTDKRFENVDSKNLLANVIGLLGQQAYAVVNVDITIIAQMPKMAPHIPAMREVLAAVMKVETAAVSIKATTTEKMGFTGREEGIAVQAVALITQS